MATGTLLTVEEFVQLLESRDVWYELVEGEVVALSPGMFLHNRIRDKLLMILTAFVESRKLGTVVSEQPFHLFGNTVRYPDVAFVGSGKDLPLRALPKGAPDLAIEVISPSNTPREIDQRVSDFFAAGCKRVWLVYPDHREVYIHGLSGVTRRTAEELLEEPELLPGFSVKVSSVFE
ncbi:MAG: Uma2 family endonuclease [Terriglobia bacterium]